MHALFFSFVTRHIETHFDLCFDTLAICARQGNGTSPDIYQQIEGSFCASKYSDNAACIPCSTFAEVTFGDTPAACNAIADASVVVGVEDLERLCAVEGGGGYGYCDSIGLPGAGDALRNR